MNLNRTRYFLFLLSILLLNTITCSTDVEDENDEFDVDNCGNTNACYLEPGNCRGFDCDNLITWKYFKDRVRFNLNTKSDGWTGIAFSRDHRLGNDHLVSCQLKDGIVKVASTFYSTKIEPLDNDDEHVAIENTHGHFEDGRIKCGFDRLKSPPKKYEGKLEDFNAHPFYIITPRGSIPQYREPMKAENYLVNSKPINFGRSGDHDANFGATRHINGSIKAHACLMIIAWILLSSISFLIARFYQSFWNRTTERYRSVCWWPTHISLSVLALILTLIAFIIILVDLNWEWSKVYDHSTIGIIVIILAVLQFVFGFCTPSPENSCLYCLYCFFHWLLGNVAFCLSIVAIFLGLRVISHPFPIALYWLIAAWAIFFMIVELILAIHQCCTSDTAEKNLGKYGIVITKKEVQMQSEKPAGYRWKPLLFIVYAVVTLIAVIAMLVLICIH